jgi:integrase
MITPNGLKQLLMWRKLCTEEYKEFNIGNDEDFIFPKLDKSELQTHYMSRMFRKILKKWDEEDLIIAEKKNRKPKLFSEDSTGTNITLYSFRHTKIVNLLIYSGRPASEVAQMADTSLLTLSRAYLQTQMLADADRYADHSINRDAFERQSDEDKKFIADAMKDFGM